MQYLNREICSTCENFDVVNIRCRKEECANINKSFISVQRVLDAKYREGYTDGYNKAWSELEERIRPLKQLLNTFE